MDIIIAIGSICTALIAVVGVIKILGSFLKQVNKIATESKDQSDVLEEVRLNVLRLTIMSSVMPLSERIAAGDIYVKNGGNGAVHAKYEELLEEYKLEHKEFDIND